MLYAFLRRPVAFFLIWKDFSFSEKSPVSVRKIQVSSLESPRILFRQESMLTLLIFLRLLLQIASVFLLLSLLLKTCSGRRSGLPLLFRECFSTVFFSPSPSKQRRACREEEFDFFSAQGPRFFFRNVVRRASRFFS